MSAFKDGTLNGKVAFVAGGTSGINLGIAKRLAELGARVAVAGRNPEKAQAAAASIGKEAKAFSCDVRDYAATRAVMEQIVAAWGPMDIVISGAAGNFLAPVAGLSANGFRSVVDIDLNGTFNVFRGCYDLIRKPGASLIAITAGQAVNPMMLQAHACAAKAGVNQLVRVLAMEWGPEGVRVNGISPGPIAGTEGMARLAPGDAVTQALTGRIPLRRFGEIPEVAESAVFLCSDSAAYITGTIIDCDGGSQLGDASDRAMSRGDVKK
jgi:NAD(P)-dependent dehydrogenase (short-subunit alcohol dehydrogenase family)